MNFLKKTLKFLIIKNNGKVYDAFPLLCNDVNCSVNPLIVCDDITSNTHLALKKEGWVLDCTSVGIEFLYANCSANTLTGTFGDLVITIEDQEIEIKG